MTEPLTPTCRRISFQVCTECGGVIHAGLCGYGCSQDATGHEGTERTVYYVPEVERERLADLLREVHAHFSDTGLLRPGLHPMVDLVARIRKALHDG